MAMEAADRRAGRSSLSPCPADLAPAPARSRRALTFELAASLELGTVKHSSADAFGSPEVLLRDPKPPASPLSPLNIAAIEQEHETLRVEEEMAERVAGADRMVRAGEVQERGGGCAVREAEMYHVRDPVASVGGDAPPGSDRDRNLRRQARSANEGCALLQVAG
jgi:hypothetical protein